MLAQRVIGKILEGNAGPGSLGIEEWRNQYQGGIENRPQPQVNAPIVRNISDNASGFLAFPSIPLFQDVAAWRVSECRICGGVYRARRSQLARARP